MEYKIRQLFLKDKSEAEKEFARIKATSHGIRIMSEKLFNLVLKIKEVDNKAANIIKQEMLSRNGEAVISRESIYLGNGKSDIIIFGTEKNIRSLAEKIKSQPFGLKSLSSEIKSFLDRKDDYEIKTDLKIAGKVFHENEKPLIMGILNLTPDSFYDGGKYSSPDDAYRKASEMISEGVSIIDVGGMSTRPGSEEIDIEEEIKRTIPLIKKIKKNNDVLVSIDTYRSRVAEKAIDAGADIINDISGLMLDNKMKNVVASNNADIIIMHMKGTPRDMQTNPVYEDVVEEIYSFFYSQINYAVEAGIDREKIIIDPGIGFGKTVNDNYTILKNIEEFKSLNMPVMIGASRKSFIGAVLKLLPEERLEGSLAIASYCALKGIDILRVHDVRETIRAVKVINAITYGYDRKCLKY
ncbi:MAG TPA: dihydropteroate synthase [Actinobacteria bacterium]|nr:dihydropteroate synthase [Actinomycetota bacterium]